ncbi:PKD domain-containing protein, partial [Pyxidicoccus sp. 3LG]
PGSRLQWRAPATPGRYFVRFQLCKDLGGRRVGVLAEQVIGIDVRACGEGESQADSLRVEVSQRGNAEFTFQAVSPDSATTYTWDFGDGTSAVTAAPSATHAYATPTSGEQDVRGFTVRLSARREGGGEQTATAFVLVRGQPPPDEPPQARLKVERVAGRLSAEGWRSEVVVEVPEGGEVTWERVERLTVSWDDQVEVRTLGWRELITVEAELGRGGFRGYVTVLPAEVRPEVKQVIDFLHGRDVTGREVALSWASFKAEPVRTTREPAGRRRRSSAAAGAGGPAGRGIAPPVRLSDRFVRFATRRGPLAKPGVGTLLPAGLQPVEGPEPAGPPHRPSSELGAIRAGARG